MATSEATGNARVDTARRTGVRGKIAERNHETKASFKTTEFWAMVVLVVSILVSAAVINGGDNGTDEFIAKQAWLYVSILGAGYFISRGPATIKDFSWWSTLKMADSRRGLEMVGDELWVVVEADEFNQPIALITKNALVLRDLDILARMASRSLVKVAISVTTLDRTVARKMEPRAPTPQRRLEAIREAANRLMNRDGLVSGAFISADAARRCPFPGAASARAGTPARR